MKMWLKSVVLVLCALETIWAKPFLQNAPAVLTSLATSASASASSPTGPVTNIADLTRRQDKAQKLQAEKLLVEDDNFQFADVGDEDKNEATPSLFQKKLNKILAKLRFFSTISTAVSGGSNNDVNTTESSDDFDEEIDKGVVTTIEETTPSTIERQTLQKIIYPHENYGAPLKLNLKIGQNTLGDELTEEENVEDVAATGRFGQIGLFFVEILGSIVGLAYGAAAHLNNTIQAQTQTQNM